MVRFAMRAGQAFLGQLLLRAQFSTGRQRQQEADHQQADEDRWQTLLVSRIGITFRQQARGNWSKGISSGPVHPCPGRS